jgi:hypothetical protein
MTSRAGTIAAMRRTTQQLQLQVKQLQLALDEQRQEALRKEQQLATDYKRALKLDVDGKPRWVSRVIECMYLKERRYLCAAATQCDGQELQWVFVDEEIVRSVQATVEGVEETKKGGKKGEQRHGVISACCQWLRDQETEGMLGGGSDMLEELVAELAELEDEALSLDASASAHDRSCVQAAIAAKRAEIATAQKRLMWRPLLQLRNDRLEQSRAKNRAESRTKQPLLWKELALLLMLQAAAMDHALRCCGRGDGAGAQRSPGASPLKFATPSTGKPGRVMAAHASASRRDSMVTQTPSLPVAEAVAADSPFTPKSFIPEENKLQQQQVHQWQSAFHRLPYMSDIANVATESAALQPLMLLLKVSAHRRTA